MKFYLGIVLMIFVMLCCTKKNVDSLENKQSSSGLKKRTETNADPTNKNLAAIPIEITEANFEDEILNSEIIVLVGFWAPWNGQSRIIAPAIEEIAREYSGRVKVGKVNVDQNAQLTTEFNIRSIPILLIFKNGKEVDRLVGALPKDQITSSLEKALLLNKELYVAYTDLDNRVRSFVATFGDSKNDTSIEDIKMFILNIDKQLAALHILPLNLDPEAVGAAQQKLQDLQ